MKQKTSIRTSCSSPSTPLPGRRAPDTYTITDNTVAIDFDAEQGGFLAGFGAAVQLKEGSFGGLFGVETDHTKLFITGFKQGVIYANENYDCNIRLNDDNFVWSGTYSDAALGQQIAAQMYESGSHLTYAGGWLHEPRRVQRSQDPC